MATHFGRIKGMVVLTFILGAGSAAPLAESQDAAGQIAQEMALSSYRAPVGLTGDDIIAQMLQRNRLRNQQLQQYSAVRTYEIRNLEGKVAAQAVVRVDYEAPGKKTFNKTSEKGSGIVRHLVFDRLMQSEGETSSGREHHDSAITTANYEFKLGAGNQPISLLGSRGHSEAQRQVSLRRENMGRCGGFRGCENRGPPC